jgi:hypothetical protein
MRIGRSNSGSFARRSSEFRGGRTDQNIRRRSAHLPRLGGESAGLAPEPKSGGPAFPSTSRRSSSSSRHSQSLWPWLHQTVRPRTEPATNNVNEYAINKAIDHLPGLRTKLSSVIDNYHNVQQDILETFVDRGQLRQLSQPHDPSQRPMDSRIVARSSSATS